MVEITEEEYNLFLHYKKLHDIKKQRDLSYYYNKRQEVSKYCVCCNIDVKYSSFINHLKSKKHLKKEKEYNEE